MSTSRSSQLLLALLVFLAASCVFLSQRGGAGGGAGGGGGGGQAPRGTGGGGGGGGQTPRGGGTAPGGGAGAQRGQAPRGLPPLGANRGDGRGQRRGQQEKPDIEPDNGLVTAYVTVTGRESRSITGLTRTNFQVFEDDVEQKIEAFSVEGGPVTVGFVVGGDPSEFRGIAPAFLKATPWNDEYFVLVDTGRPPGGTVIQSFTTDIQKVPKNFFVGGVTPDSIYVGLDYLKEAANRRKLLLLFGGSLNADGTTSGGLDPDYVVRMATSQRVQVYSILTNNDGGETFDDSGTSDIAHLTGGRNYTTFAAGGTLESIAEEISRQITVQYLIGYRSSNTEKNGKWRGIKVQLVNPPEDQGKLKVWTRSGYYSEKEKKKG